MMHRYGRSMLACLVSVGLLISGCAQRGQTEVDERQIGLGGASTARAEIIMGAGQLTLRGGVVPLAQARFTYDSPLWKPEVSYKVERTEGLLVVRQPQTRSEGWSGANQRYLWDIAFNENIPLDLAVTLGAGQADLWVGTLNLTGLDVKTGAGQVHLDLVGARQRDLYVRVQGGVGELVVDLPSDVGVVVDVQGGLGAIETEGLIRKGAAYVNDAYGLSRITVHLAVQGGVGAIRLRVVEKAASAHV